MSPQDLEELDARGAGDAVVQDHRHRLVPRDASEGRREVAGFLALEAGAGEEVPEECPGLGVPVDDQEARGG